ncbi:MAG TPA: hypothetical protein VJW76_04750, partial [Verrucomicrobiae bacterium]|nr:hypothetical protein [Verrucomicrobiae bacterium]
PQYIPPAPGVIWTMFTDGILVDKVGESRGRSDCAGRQTAVVSNAQLCEAPPRPEPTRGFTPES